MRRPWFVSALCLLALAAAPARAQFSLGLGGGAGLGSRGRISGSNGGHANVSLELKLPILPGVRGDLYYLSSPLRPGHVSAAVSAVLAAPVPVVTPYLVAGWGAYGVDGSASLSGWNIGAGVRASVIVGPSVFVEVRRHDRFARDLLTVGVRF